MKSNLVAIVQERCNSLRLKNNVLANIEDKPLIQWVINRVKKSTNHFNLR